MFRLMLCVLLAGTLVCAATPVAKVTSSKSFRIGGVPVPVAGVPNWPLVDGDEVAMAKGPGEVVFQDGTRLYVLPETRFTVTVEDKRAAVQLSEGGMAYLFSKDSSVELSVGKTRIPARSKEGRVMALDGKAYWDPTDIAFHMVVDSGERQQRGDPGEFAGSQLTPFNLDLVNQWEDYKPPFGNPPGEDPPPGEAPPAQDIEAPELRPVSNWRP